MNSPSDANRLKRLAKSQLALGANILQGAGLGTLVSKLELEVKGDVLMLAVAVSDDELKQVLSRIDMSAPAEQNPTSPTEPGKPDAAGQPAAVPADQSPADGGAKAPTSDAQPADTQASSQER
jgi:hypothetical protein